MCMCLRLHVRLHVRVHMRMRVWVPLVRVLLVRV